MCVLAGMCVATSHTRTRMTRVSVLHIKYIELYCHNALMGIAISYPYGYECGTELLGGVLIGISINLINNSFHSYQTKFIISRTRTYSLHTSSITCST